MDYTAWSQEYTETALAVDKTIKNLLNQRKSCTHVQAADLDSRIRAFRTIKYECLKTADILRRRAECR